MLSTGLDNHTIVTDFNVFSYFNKNNFDFDLRKHLSTNHTKRERYVLSNQNRPFRYRGPEVSFYPKSKMVFFKMSSKHLMSYYPNRGQFLGNFYENVEYINNQAKGIYQICPYRLQEGVLQNAEIFSDISNDLLHPDTAHILGYGRLDNLWDKVIEGNETFLGYNEQYSLSFYDKNKEVVVKYLHKRKYKHLKINPPNTHRIELRGKNAGALGRLVFGENRPILLKELLPEKVQLTTLRSFVNSMKFPNVLGVQDEV